MCLIILQFIVRALKYYLRVNVTLMQFDEFYETYKISSGNKMYMPKNKRIAVW